MPKQPQSTIDHSGRVAIPKAIRIRLGLLPGTKLVIEERDDKVVLLRPLPDKVSLVDKDGVLVVQSRAVGEIMDAKKRVREARVAELVGRTGR